MTSADRPATRLATRLSFLVAGFGIACWAPLVPFAKERLANFKVPRAVAIVEALPHNAAGKVVKGELRAGAVA